MDTDKLPTYKKMSVGSGLQTETRQESSSSDVEKENNTLQPSQKTGNSKDSMRVGNPSLKNSKGKKLPTAENAYDTMKLVTASTLNWLLVRILYLELGSVGKAEGQDYYEIRLPTRIWTHDGRVFKLVNSTNTEAK